MSAKRTVVRQSKSTKRKAGSSLDVTTLSRSADAEAATDEKPAFLSTVPVLPIETIEDVASRVLDGASCEVPPMRELVDRHVEGGLWFMREETKILNTPAFRTYLGPGLSEKPGWAGFIRRDLDKIAWRDAVAWIVASVAFEKQGINATYGDELCLARALKMPRRIFLEVLDNGDEQELAEAFMVTPEEVRARRAEVEA